jgi:hypothetical protein
MTNRLEFITVAFEAGYASYLPVVEEGIDLIIYRESDRDLRKVQIKSRWTIDKRYEGREMWMAFPHASEWYLAQHDTLVKLAKKLGLLEAASWIISGKYNRVMSGILVGRMQPYLFPTAEAEE